MLLPVASRVPDYARLIGALVLDERMPAERKVMLGAAAGYLVLGRDLIPDSIPLIGGLDDLVIVVLAVDVFLDGVPPELLQEKLDDLAIDRVAFDRDVAQIRRLTPGPVRRTIRPRSRPHHGRRTSRRTIRHRPRTRAWINKEEPDHSEGHPDQGRPALGKSGELKQVADGYATNYLIPCRLPCRRRRGLSRVAARHREPRGQAPQGAR